MRANLEAFAGRPLRLLAARGAGPRRRGARPPLPVPFLLAVGVPSILHEDAEPPSRASAATGVPLVLSSAASTSSRTSLPSTRLWFQLYWWGDDELAETSSAAPRQRLRPIVLSSTRSRSGGGRATSATATCRSSGQGLGQFLTDPLSRPARRAARRRTRDGLLPRARHLPESRAHLGRPRRLALDVATGAREGRAARRRRAHALEHGVGGIVVSNHGGRQVDGAVAPRRPRGPRRGGPTRFSWTRASARAPTCEGRRPRRERRAARPAVRLRLAVGGQAGVEAVIRRWRPSGLTMASPAPAGGRARPLLRHVRAMLDAAARGEVAAPVARLVGMRLVRGRRRGDLGARRRPRAPRQPDGHGARRVLCDVADAAMGVAYASLLGEGESFTTLELKINFLKPVRGGRGRRPRTGRQGRANDRARRVRRRGRDGSLVARASSTCMTLRGDAATGR